MAIKKSELYSSIWTACDKLRGGMDASQYKDYVLSLLSLKYISDKHSGKTFAPIVVPPESSFSALVRLKGNKDIGDKINKDIVQGLINANDKMQSTDFPNFNDPAKLGSGQEMVNRLTDLIGIFETLDFTKNQAENDDILGDAYEYLMRHFAVQSGKSKGQYYTPSEVSRLMAELLGLHKIEQLLTKTTVHDPACGSGSLLLKVFSEAAKRPDFNGVTLYGQENDVSTAGIARMNMILHGAEAATIATGNTLAAPQFLESNGLKTFDYVVANPPYSQKEWKSGINTEKDPCGRFGLGIPPDKQGDYMWVLHILKCLNDTGTGVVVLPHGVLFRGGAEAVIRANILKKGYLKTVIGLPANLFYGTGIPAAILVFQKTPSVGEDGVMVVDASNEFVKDGSKNRLRERDIRRIVDAVEGRRQEDGFSRWVPMSEIEANEWNLNIPRYIQRTNEGFVPDLGAHLHGGIPQTDVANLPYWGMLPGLKEDLFEELRPGYLGLKTSNVMETIEQHEAMKTLERNTVNTFERWWSEHASAFRDFQQGMRVKTFLDTALSDVLLKFQQGIDPYAVYQQFHEYRSVWDDDLGVISSDGWAGAARLVLMDKSDKGQPDVEVGKERYKSALVPGSLMRATHFSFEATSVENLRVEAQRLEQEKVDLEEEHAGEDGVLEDVGSEKAMAKRLQDSTDPEEAAVLTSWLAIVRALRKNKEDLKQSEEYLGIKMKQQYDVLDDDAVKALVVERKWKAHLKDALLEEVQRVKAQVVSDIGQLSDMYDVPLGEVSADAFALEAKVNGYLVKMGGL